MLNLLQLVMTRRDFAASYSTRCKRVFSSLLLLFPFLLVPPYIRQNADEQRLVGQDCVAQPMRLHGICTCLLVVPGILTLSLHLFRTLERGFGRTVRIRGRIVVLAHTRGTSVARWSH